MVRISSVQKCVLADERIDAIHISCNADLLEPLGVSSPLSFLTAFLYVSGGPNRKLKGVIIGEDKPDLETGSSNEE